MLSSAGVGSGLDVPTIIGQLMNVERQPLVKLQNRQGNIQSKISSFGMLKSMMSNFNSTLEKFSDVSKIKSHSVNSSDKTVLTASISGTPSVSKYSIDVLSLAQSHKIASPLYASATDPVGEGRLSVSIGTSTFDFDLVAGSNSLEDLRDRLNDTLLAEGVRANIVNVDGGSRLMISTQNTGVDNAIKITVSGDADGNDTDTNGLSQLVFDPLGAQNMTEISAALDAEVKVDGFLVTSGSNTLTDTIPDVSFDLKSIGTSVLTVNSDDSAFKNSIADVVSSYNNLQNVMVGLKSDGLKGEGMLSSIEQKLRNSFSSLGSSANGMNAYKLGIEFDRYGKMSFDGSKFNDLSVVDKKNALDFFSDPREGLATKITDAMDLYVRSEGFIDSVTTGLGNQIKYMDTSIESMQRRLVNREITLSKQFTALDTLIAGMEATSGFLTQQLESLQASDNA
ncbi:MAG: flagellar filament capping protein FliD [Gammaproteobacteria bacterium]|nr:flagellar filament capping protein FliD [Gammaproteobacteria bacterium]